MEKLQKKIANREKLFKKFKNSKLNIDEQIFKESQKEVRNLIKIKKKRFFEDKLTENIKANQKSYGKQSEV